MKSLFKLMNQMDKEIQKVNNMNPSKIQVDEILKEALITARSKEDPTKLDIKDNGEEPRKYDWKSLFNRLTKDLGIKTINGKPLSIEFLQAIALQQLKRLGVQVNQIANYIIYPESFQGVPLEIENGDLNGAKFAQIIATNQQVYQNKKAEQEEADSQKRSGQTSQLHTARYQKKAGNSQPVKHSQAANQEQGGGQAANTAT